MEINYVLIYHTRVLSEDIPKLNGSWRKKIKKALEQKLTTEPTLYGKPLRKDLSGCFKLRISDYRAIYQVHKNTVRVIAIQHRSVVYQNNLNPRL